MRHEAPLVLLAVNSPIYAPIVLAKALPLEGAGTVELQLAAPPSRGRRVGERIDALVQQCLSLTGIRERTIIGVGDPMRLAAVKGLDAMSEPLLLGSLITKMCYWIIHAREDRKHGEATTWDQKFEAVIAHPIGMTGFTVPFYDLKAQLNNPEPKKKLVTHGSDPNNEVPVFEGVRALWKKREARNRLPPALVTTNPYYATQASSDNSRLDVARAYPGKAPFDNVVMTGMFVAAEGYEGSRAIVVSKFMEATSKAIAIIKEDPTYAACMIWAGFQRDRELIRGGVPFFGLPSPMALAQCLRELAARGVYNTDPGFCASGSAINNTIDMYAALEKDVPEARQPRSTEEMRVLLGAIQGGEVK